MNAESHARAGASAGQPGGPIEFFLPKLTPSLNLTTRGHWSQEHKELAEWRQWLAWARGQAQRWDRPGWERVRLIIERRAPQPIEDDTNLEGGIKCLEDALVREGYFKDDNRKVVVERRVTQKKVPRSQQGTWVRIEPLTLPPSAAPAPAPTSPAAS